MPVLKIEYYRLSALLVFLAWSVPACPQPVKVTIRPEAVYVTEAADSILVYHLAERSLGGNYARSNYIHPLYGLDGEVLTEDFPDDHLHHRGIFWAWHQLFIGDERIGDGWELRDISWEVQAVREAAGPTGSRTILAEIFWKSPLWLDEVGEQKAFIREHTGITVHPAGENYRPIDFEISLIALEAGIRIGGSEDEKGYGGFSARIRLADSMEFTGPAGRVTPQNLPVTAGGWMDISGPIGRSGARSGLSILAHPDNPGFPNPWILRASGSMQNAVFPFPGAEPVALRAGEPLTLRYRLLVHSGSAASTDLPRLFQEFAATE